jgi:hypothetical protein
MDASSLAFQAGGGLFKKVLMNRGAQMQTASDYSGEE